MQRLFHLRQSPLENRLRNFSQANSLTLVIIGSDPVGALRLAGLGTQFGAALPGGLNVGQWLDRRLGTAPVFLYVGVAIGAIGGFVAPYRQFTRALREEEEARQRCSAQWDSIFSSP